MKIIVTNQEKLNAAIREAEGKATVRTVSATGIIMVLNKVGSNIAKSKLSGTKVHYDGGQHFAKAYKYTPESTHWIAENIKGKWYITDIYRGICPNKTKNTHVEYSETAKQAIIENASDCWL